MEDCKCAICGKVTTDDRWLSSPVYYLDFCDEHYEALKATLKERIRELKGVKL